jgi:hypothetical protein
VPNTCRQKAGKALTAGSLLQFARHNPACIALRIRREFLQIA